ncbi:nucleotidyltransferase [Actinoplanes sp. LDG1-06]|uniref:Nucleotidyltransferase n=1 Tax=Paractinoplanes ovalisporus TaxID=2810368 RepID=A0ABS2AM93_9ACTN|nr:nucleotidyltransferase [Actinoplanes ovalisporus]MBM2620951.1 nucleotidyltransferase [Actinoplanes ovalisporus]
MTTTDAERRNWTTPGTQDAAQNTYTSVKAALDRSTALRNLRWEVFLQGSYANATNTRGDSDVDVVVMLTSTMYPDVSRLLPADQDRQQRGRRAGTTSAGRFRTLVHQALIDYYGTDRVHPKNKCLRVDRTAGYVDADVVPTLQHRLYTSYPAYGQPTWIEGVAIDPLHGPRVVNYPKEHIKNGRDKNKRCSERYKPTVRQIKNLRKRAVATGLLADGIAPGYLLECMTYNVPDTYFLTDDSARLSAVLAWLNNLSIVDLTNTFKSGDEVHRLFVNDPGHHDAATASQILAALWRTL